MQKDPLLRGIEIEMQKLHRRVKQLEVENATYDRLIAHQREQIKQLERQLADVAKANEKFEGSIQQKSLEEWGARDFLAHFQQLHLTWCGQPYHFSRQLYEACLAQLKGARRHYNLDNATIKEIFDFHFTQTFNDRFTPSVAYITGAAGMNRFYSLRSRAKAAPSNPTRYTRTQLEGQEDWKAGEEDPAAEKELEKRMKRK
jgi:hypothetical protein